MKLLTIVIPTYNRANLLVKCINSIYTQIENLTDIDFIILDNCSTDNTKKIVSEYIKDKNIIYIKNEKNIGPDLNFLKALQISNSKYIHIISDDDYMMKNSFNYEYSFLKNNTDLDLAYTNLIHFNDKNLDNYYNKLFNLEKSIVLTSKSEFMNYVKNDITFLSGIIFNKLNFLKIKDPEKYNNTNWLQSYVAFDTMCSTNVKLGLISTPIIAVHDSLEPVTYNYYSVFGKNQKLLYKHAYQNCGFKKKVLIKLYKSRLKQFSRKLASDRIDKKKNLLSDFWTCVPYTWMYPFMWIRVYSIFLIPRWILKKIKYGNTWKKIKENKYKNS